MIIIIIILSGLTHADAIIPAAPPAEALPVTKNVPANAENLERF